MDPAVYQLFSRACPTILLWLMGFLSLTMGSLGWRAWHQRSDRHHESMIGGELPGLPLVLMHSVCFGSSLYRHDWVSAVVFGWWGPGFLVVATLVLAKRRIAWAPIARLVSLACKFNYLVLVGLFAHHRQWAPIFAYSLWIMHDQVRLAWLQGNADRTRRTTEDWWLPRLCYPLFLGIPLIDSALPWRWACAAAALIVVVLWVWGLLRLVRLGIFFTKPRSFTENLRDIVYLPKTGTGSG